MRVPVGTAHCCFLVSCFIAEDAAFLPTLSPKTLKTFFAPLAAALAAVRLPVASSTAPAAGPAMLASASDPPCALVEALAATATAPAVCRRPASPAGPRASPPAVAVAAPDSMPCAVSISNCVPLCPFMTPNDAATPPPAPAPISTGTQVPAAHPAATDNTGSDTSRAASALELEFI